MSAPRCAFAAALLVATTPLLAYAKDEGPAQPLTFIFVGGAHGDDAAPTLTHLKGRLATADPESTLVVFTGDYAQGELPAKGDEDREQVERSLGAHVAAVKEFFDRGGRVYFLPGPLDFDEGGTKAVRRMRKELNAQLAASRPDEKIDVMPEAACGDGTLLELSPNVALLLANTQWWMQNGAEDPNFNDACDTKSRKAFLGNIGDAMRRYRSRRLIIAMHHPLDSWGEHGGHFTAAAHLDPAPVVGTALVVARKAGLVPQYQASPFVHRLALAVRNEADRYGSFVFVSGHDENLQALKLGPQLQLVSGTSASQARPVVTPVEGDVAIAAPGWVELHLDESGEGEARLIRGGEELAATIPLPPLRALAEKPRGAPAPMPEGPVMATYSKRPVWHLPGVVRFFTGSYYSETFHVSMPYEVLDLEAEGLVPYKVGGGQQTNSVRLKDAQGGDWVIRSTTKDAGRMIPYPFGRVTPLERVLEYAFTATQPEAALTVSKLSEAVGVHSVEPRLLYLPDQAALGPYRGFISDEVVQLEQRPNEMAEGFAPPAHLGGRDDTTRFKAYAAAAEKVLEHPEKHRVDQEAMLRARLLDVFVGDFDRHPGQWRFAINEDENGVKIYSPVAMDRDQAFPAYDGAGLFVSRLMVPQARQPRWYSSSYGSLRWLNYNARDVDALMLNRIEHDRWMEIAREVQAALTDDVIDGSMSQWHREAYALDGARIARTMKERRGELVEVAEDFYRYQARAVDVPGSMQDDVFALRFEADGRVRVTVRPKDGDVWYARTFDPAETKELRLYALDGDDVLELQGAAHDRIDVRFVGGEGKDQVVSADGSTVKAESLVVYDRTNGLRIAEGVAVDDERSEQAYLNQYDPLENHDFDYGGFMPGLIVNPDVGALIGGTYTHVVPGYKKAKFAAMHAGSVYFATSTLGVGLDYHGMFPESLERLDQLVDVTVRSPQFTRNFYGRTNTLRGIDVPNEFWRVSQALADARYGVSVRMGSGPRVGAQLLGQGFYTERTEGRYIAEATDVSPDELGARGFLGGSVFMKGSTIDNPMLPRRGIAARAALEGRFDVARPSAFSTTGLLSAAVVFPLERSERFVILTSASVEGILGPHPFYLAPTLGMQQLRAYGQQQLTGDLAFAHTTDLRIDVLRIESVVPGTVGVQLSVDHGRVWNRGEASNAYHVSLGGGLWWSIVDVLALQLGYHRSLDGASRFSFSVGPMFADPNL